MVRILDFLLFAIAALSAASPLVPESSTVVQSRSDHAENTAKDNCSPACGKYNFVFTGLPWNHPAVAASGFTPQQVEAGIRQDMAAIVKAGYNIKAVLLGPEDSLDFLSSELQGVNWRGVGVGFGVRGNPSPVITRRLMDIIQLYRDEEPRSRILFNYSPVTSLWAIREYFPLPNNCTDSPGKDLGIAIRCKACNPPN